MAVRLAKYRYITVLTFVITFYAGKCLAFPIWYEDMERIAEATYGIYLQTDEIQQEINSNMMIIKEIQQGGYAAAASDLFLKIENGDYDRYGNNLKILKTRVNDASYSTVNMFNKKAAEKMKRNQEMNDKIKQEMAKQDNSAQAAEAALQKQKKKSIFNNAYEWLKNNRTTTDAILNSANSVQNGDWRSVVNDAAQKASGNLTASGYEGYGGFVNNSNNALNAILDGDLSGVVDSGAGLYSVTHGDEISTSGAIRDTNNALGAALRGDWSNAYDAVKNGNTAAQMRAKEELQQEMKDNLNKTAEEIKKQEEQKQINQWNSQLGNINLSTGGK